MMTCYTIDAQSPLYEDVQRSGIFPDSKFFPDCRPKRAPAVILEEYLTQKDRSDFGLLDFIEANYFYPENPQTGYDSAGKTMEAHLQALWPLLTRCADAASTSTLIPLPHPYIVPGGRFREVYYWDSYFTMLGLKVSGQTALMRSMVDNFAWLIDTLGFIPNGNRTYYLGRSQPPFFALMIDLLCDSDAKAMAHYQDALAKEYAFWMDGFDRLNAQTPAWRRVVRMPDGAVLNRYWDDFDTPRPEAWLEDTHLAEASGQPNPVIWRHIRAAAESGWDFSSRWFADGENFATIQTTSLIPVDLNCLLLFLEQCLQKIYAGNGNQSLANDFLAKAEARKAAILQYCWNPEQGFFFDYQWEKGILASPLTMAAVFPLFFNVATQEQAQSVSEHIASSFLKPGGFVTTLTTTGQQWDAPNGWAPLQWMGYQGLKRYGMDDLAGKVRHNWLQLNQSVFAATGKMMEKYNVEDTNLKAGGGEYPNQDGFGWTNGVYLGLTKT